tara:strand:- start:363 stop:815 length:453 start_codon:yes stop_codon:yes gene_type:complete
MTRFTYPVQVKSADTNVPSVSFVANTVMPVLLSVTFADTSVSAATTTINGPIVPAGLRVRGISVNLNASWNSVSGTTLSVGAGATAAFFASGIDLQTSTGNFRILPTQTAAQVSNAAVPLAADTTLTLTVSVSGSVVPSAGSALVIIEMY